MRKTKKACTKIAGCPAFDCSEPNCRRKKTAVHVPPVRKDATAVKHKRERYNTSRWQKLRSQQLAAEPLCQRCLTYSVYTPAIHVDHVQPHRGDWKRFYDAENLQSLCPSCHSWKTVEEGKGRIHDFRQPGPNA